MITLHDKLRTMVEADDWPTDPATCVEWKNYRNAAGYGQVWVDGKVCKVHRIAYAASRWLDLDGIDDLVVMHRCHRPSCFRPSHLKLGTQLDNMRDCVDSGRNYYVNITECPAGHIYDLKNTYIAPGGSRKCRACLRLRDAARQPRRAALKETK